MKLVAPCVFPKSVLSGTTAITNSKSNSASPWKTSLWIFTSANFFPPAVNFTHYFFMVYSMTSSDIFYILRQSIIQFCGTISYTLWLSIYVTAMFLSRLFLMCWSMYSRCPVFVLWWHPFCSSGNSPRLISKSSPNLSGYYFLHHG